MKVKVYGYPDNNNGSSEQREPLVHMLGECNDGEPFSFSFPPEVARLIANLITVTRGSQCHA
jgi:hypothetical protein